MSCDLQGQIAASIAHELIPILNLSLIHHPRRTCIICSKVCSFYSISSIDGAFFSAKFLECNFSPVERDKMLEVGFFFFFFTLGVVMKHDMFILMCVSFLLVPLIFMAIVLGSDSRWNFRDVWLWNVEKSNVLQADKATGIWCELHSEFIADMDGVWGQWCIGRCCWCAAYNQGIGIKTRFALSWKLRSHRFPVEYES